MLEYKMEIRLEKKDFDEKGEIRPGALLRFFQDIAALHADQMGIGFDDMMKDDLIWIITKLRCRIAAPLSPGQNCYILTYPRKKRSRICPRDYYLYDEADKLCAYGTSLWSVINYKTRKLERIPFDYGEELYEKDAFPEGFEKLHMENPRSLGSYTVKKEDLDVNDHTNNCRYADLVRSISEVERIGEFTIQFSKETRLGDEILLSGHKEAGQETIRGSLAGDETVFLAKLKEA